MQVTVHPLRSFARSAFQTDQIEYCPWRQSASTTRGPRREIYSLTTCKSLSDVTGREGAEGRGAQGLGNQSGSRKNNTHRFLLLGDVLIARESLPAQCEVTDKSTRQFQWKLVTALQSLTPPPPPALIVLSAEDLSGGIKVMRKRKPQIYTRGPH